MKIDDTASSRARLGIFVAERKNERYFLLEPHSDEQGGVYEKQAAYPGAVDTARNP